MQSDDHCRMIAELPYNPLLLAAGIFLLGWILGSLSARLGARQSARKRDPRDDRIRSLEAEHRISKNDVGELREKLESSEKALEAALSDIEKRDNVIAHQQSSVDKLKADLKDSVRKTAELRHELQERATENIRSEVKARELETELSVAQASTDMIATGVLDYSLADDLEEDIEALPRPVDKHAG